MRQICITTSMGKRLIGKGMAAHPAIQDVLNTGTLVIIAGTTNGYVAEEVLASLEQADGFSRMGFRRGVVVPPGFAAPTLDLPGDVVIVKGQWRRGLTVDDIAGSLREGDVVLKGANAFDQWGHAGVLIGHPRGGTILAALPAVIGSRVRLIVPVGVEKRIFDDIESVAQRLNAPGASGPRLCPLPGSIFTELDAIELLTGAQASLVAAGGIYGAEGAAWLSITGTDEQQEAVAALIDAVAGEPPCEA